MISLRIISGYFFENLIISKDEDDADDEYVEDETEKKAQYEILDENGTFLIQF